MTHDVVNVSIEQRSIKNFGEVISLVDGGVNPFQYHQIALDPFGECKIPNIHVPGMRCGLLGVRHGCGTVIVLVNDGSSLLWNAKVV